MRRAISVLGIRFECLATYEHPGFSYRFRETVSCPFFLILKILIFTYFYDGTLIGNIASSTPNCSHEPDVTSVF